MTGIEVTARVWSGALALSAAGALLLACGAEANTLQFGPVGAGAGTTGASSDREFIREWEANPPKGYPTLAKANVEAVKAAIRRYQAIVEAGGWPELAEVEMQAGSGGPHVAALRRRLNISGDLSEAGGADYDYYVEKAVMRYQASNGLAPTGIVDKRTIAALNVPAEARLKQLKTNLGRLSELAGTAGVKYVAVNIPAAQIEVVQGGQIVSRHAGVVGKIDRPTPLLRSAISELNFNPVWRLPPTVVTKDLIPKGKDMQARGESVLTKYHIDAYEGGRKLGPNEVDWNSSQPTRLSYSQQPGKDNPLGFLKINFASAESVYMHDTPSEGIFGRNFRAASSGCIRVQGIDQLAMWLLAPQGWQDYHITRLKESGERRNVRIKKPVPLLFVYITAWATPDGVVQFRRDLYQKDGVGAIAAAY